jgi:hypothetical protein
MLAVRHSAVEDRIGGDGVPRGAFHRVRVIFCR